MTALDPRELLVDLVGLVDRVGVGRGRAGIGEAATPTDRTEPRNRLTAADPEGRIGTADVRPVERSRDDRDLVVADQDLIDERRAENAVPVERDVAERESVRLPRSSGCARLSFRDSYSETENRPNTLSVADRFQSTRTSA